MVRRQELTYKKNKNYALIFITIYAISFFLFGLLVDTPKQIIDGLYSIITERDVLVTDYFQIAGIGAAFVNSGVLTLVFIFILYKLKINFKGVTIATLFLISGFALFGKNIVNVWPIIIGVYLYSLVQRDKFSKYIYIALLGTTMAPMVSEMFIYTDTHYALRLVIGVFVGIIIGFLLPPLGTFMIRVHQGFNLYNIGFAAGLLGLIFVSIFMSYGFKPNTRLIWSTGHNLVFSIFLYSIFSLMIIVGFFLNGKTFRSVRKLMKYSGRLIADFITMEGFPPALINMGLNGLMATSYVLLINGDLNGPTIGGILTISGFGGLGKHPRNIWPIFLGVYVGSLTKVWNINDPLIQLAALFGTSLAPIAGEFGWFYGMLAAFIHSSVVQRVGILSGGLNLYNNGFSAGLVATFLVPIIEAFKKDEIS